MISVITVCYNTVDTIEDTIISVRQQMDVNVEHIIIDGGSTDGTLDVISRYQDVIDVCVSEPDNGIYDAMNKGLDLASGDIIGFLNSDDYYFNHQVLKKISSTFEDENVDICFSDLIYVDKNNIRRGVRYWQSSQYKPGLFERGWIPPHPTFYARSELFRKYGQFDVSYRYASDYDLMMRFLLACGNHSRYLPFVSVCMRTGGETNRSLRNIIRGNREIYRISRKNGIRLSPFFPIYKVMSRFLQFTKRSVIARNNS